MADRVRYRLRIYGKVQGVFFRKYAQMTAQSLGLGGFVRNEPDGSVYAEVEGPPEAVENFVKMGPSGIPCRKGRTRGSGGELKAPPRRNFFHPLSCRKPVITSDTGQPA
jgi:acylphosphatase